MADKIDLNHLHLHVRNLDNARRFGFDLALVPDRKPSSFPEWFHFGFRLATPRAVRQLRSRMSSEGVRVEGIEDYENYVTFRCMDPDGNSIEIYWS
jgi:catechol-2,3-dioxygenase